MARSLSLVARVRPWHAALRQLGSPELPTYLDAEPESYDWLWIKDELLLQTTPNSRALSNVKVYEALSLLALLARVDFDAWAQTLLEVWPGREMEEWLDEIRFKRMPVDYVRVGVSFPEQGQEREVEKLDMICDYTDFDIASPEFCATYWFIKGAEPEEEIDAAALVIPARVKLELWQTTPAEITNVLKLVGHFVERSKANALSETSNKMTIEIQNVRITDSYGFAVEMGGLRAFKDLWAMGVHVNLFLISN